MADEQPRLYTDLAPWYHLLTAPEEYDEEADFYWRVLSEASSAPPRTLLDLGCGGGNLAWHYKAHVQATLTDLSPDMLALSRTINPECEHIQGDMRTLRLGRTFDAVLLHDAVVYMTTEDELRQAMMTAFVHLRPGGVAIFAPDHIREHFAPATDHGGHDGDGRALRYLEWTWDPDPADSTYLVDYAYVLRDESGRVECVHDRHVEGLFARADWLRLLTEVGFQAQAIPFEHSEIAPWTMEIFVAVRPVR